MYIYIYIYIHTTFNEQKHQKRTILQKWDARVHWTRDLKHLNPHDELYQITWSKWLKNGI